MEIGRTRPYFPLHPSTAERLIVQGDVEIGVTIPAPNSQNVSFKIEDWTGGTLDYPDITDGNFGNLIAGDHLFIKSFNSPSTPSAPWTSGEARIQFYGPGRAEAGGSFNFNYRNSMNIYGVYGAKKQAE